MSELPEKSWSELSMDFSGPFPNGDCLMVVIDDYSRYPVVDVVKSTSANTVISKLTTYSQCPMNSKALKDFATNFGFKHRKVTPLWPRANGEVERFMRTLKNALIKSAQDGLPWKQGLYAFLRNYRATPHCSTGKPPAEVLFSKEFSTKLPNVTKPILDSKVKENDLVAKQTMKVHGDKKLHAKHHNLKIGDSVFLRQQKTNKLSAPYENALYTVKQINGSMITAERDSDKER